MNLILKVLIAEYIYMTW